MSFALLGSAALDSIAARLPHAIRVIPDTSWRAVLHALTVQPPDHPWLDFVEHFVVPLIAALVGALVGGLLARKAALDAFHHQQQAASAHARLRLIHYLRRSLEATQTVGMSLTANITSTHDAPWRDVAREVLSIWSSYDQFAPDLHLLGSYQFTLKYHTFVIGLRLVVRSTLTGERNLDPILRRPYPRDSIQAERHRVIREVAQKSRAVFLDAAKKWPSEVADLLRLLPTGP